MCYNYLKGSAELIHRWSCGEAMEIAMNLKHIPNRSCPELRPTWISVARCFARIYRVPMTEAEAARELDAIPAAGIRSRLNYLRALWKIWYEENNPVMIAGELTDALVWIFNERIGARGDERLFEFYMGYSDGLERRPPAEWAYRWPAEIERMIDYICEAPAAGQSAR